jgi:hypothetical protein
MINYKRKGLEPMFLNEYTDLWDKINKKRVGHLLPKEIRQHGIYKESPEWTKYHKKWTTIYRNRFKAKMRRLG